jgi:hypothetical protein
MAKATKKTSRGRKQDRARVAGGAGLRGALRGEEDATHERRSEESRQESRL